MLLEGLHIPLTTPFHPDGRLNPPKLAANVARYSKSPTAGLLVLGPVGEPTLLSDDETREVLRAAVQAAAPEKVLIAGISRDSLRATLALADFAAQQNYDAVLIAIPSLFFHECKTAVDDSTAAANSGQSSATHRCELLLYFQTLADRSPLPVVLYSDHARNLPHDAVVELAAHPRILGLLDAQSRATAIEVLLQRTAAIRREVAVTPTFAAVTARMKAAAISSAPLLSAATLTANSATAVAEPTPLPALRTRTKSVGFQILSAHAPRLLGALNAGAVGIAPAFAAAAPQATYEVYAAWKDQDQPLALEKQARIVEAARLIDSLGPSGLKFACDLNGYFGGHARLPHLPPTGEQRAAIERLLMHLLRN